MAVHSGRTFQKQKTETQYKRMLTNKHGHRATIFGISICVYKQVIGNIDVCFAARELLESTVFGGNNGNTDATFEPQKTCHLACGSFCFAERLQGCWRAHTTKERQGAATQTHICLLVRTPIYVVTPKNHVRDK